MRLWEIELMFIHSNVINLLRLLVVVVRVVVGVEVVVIE